MWNINKQRGTFIIAEVGSVHDGSFGNALKLIEVASECGVDAVKFQTHIAEFETLPNAPSPSYFQNESRYKYFQRTGFTLQQWRQIKQHCNRCNVEFMSSPFSKEAVELLEKIDVALYKIPSGEVTNLPLLEKISKTKKHVLLSSGMNSWQEIDNAVDVIQKKHKKLTILQCTSEYPCPPESVGLNVMLEMKERYNTSIGLSDHTITPYASYAAVTLGAKVIEKHFTFSRKMYGSDAKHSLEPDDTANLVRGIRDIEKMLDSYIDKDDISQFKDMKKIFEKSVVAKTDIKKGTTITKNMLGVKKPGTGIPTAKIDDIIGKKARKNIQENTLIDMGYIK